MIGPENFTKYQHIFGFGEYTGIDLPGEAETSGLLYTADTMKPVDLATSSFGWERSIWLPIHSDRILM